MVNLSMKQKLSSATLERQHIQIDSVNINGGRVSLIADHEGESIEDTDRGSIINNGVVTGNNLDINSYDSVTFTGNVDVLSANIVKGDFTYVGTDTVAIDKVYAGGAVDISSQSGSITDHANDSEIDITSGEGKITLKADLGIQATKTGDAFLEIADGTTLLASSQNAGDIQIQGMGTLNLENITATDGNIHVKAQGDIIAGLITSNKQISLISEGAISGTSPQISSQTAILSSGTGIGTSDQAIALDVSYLDLVSTQSGGIYVNFAKAVTLSDLNDDGYAVQSMGDGKIESVHSIHITGAANLDSNEFTIKAGDNSETNTLIIDASITQTGIL
ncbi:MAG: hypothetical protein OMM_04338 [Candidatus Magnetoglobus multicellularis str. Araruama]|uniref:Uncharacterized protein n=1 Tax=Candidatus Magnetoglobus multicellularis str. Araruama TaxID=890399 RepID=A0A1V1P1Z7_9BACT|nr:MAG: hypothetical protein OMM_04338 [Candidatus Magnetoglobus multicellularis str. Araruama]